MQLQCKKRQLISWLKVLLHWIDIASVLVCRHKGTSRFKFLELVKAVWVWNLVADIAGGKEAEGVWEHGVEENIWT